MNTGAFGENFPYTNFHDLNMDWIIKIAKDFLDQYTHIQETIESGLEALDEKATNLEALLQEWYDTHSEDIANQLADALQDLNDWYTTHENYLNQTLQNNITAFDNHAEQKAAQTIESIPDDYTTVATNVTNIVNSIENDNIEFLANNEGYYVKADGTIDSNPYLRVSDFIRIPNNANAVYAYVLRNHSTAFNPVGCFYDEDQNFISAMGSGNHVSGYKTWLIPNNAKYVKFNQSVSTDDNDYFMFRFNCFSYENTDFVGSDAFSIVSADRWSAVGNTLLKQGVTYKIVARGTRENDRYRFFIQSASTGQIVSSDYFDFPSYENSAIIIPSESGFLKMYNVENTNTEIAVNIYTYSQKEIKTTKHEYYVAKTTTLKDATHFNSLTECLIALKNDENEKTIYIEGGDYDIVQEYIDANVPVYTGNNPNSEYFNYCVWVPKNTHIIGKGNVKLIWMPTAGTITLNQSKTVSPLNVCDTCTIENIEVYCKNGRYCLHNDGLNYFKYVGAKQVYKNVKFVKYDGDTDPVSGETYGFAQTIGFGISARMCYEFNGCEFINESGSAFYGHSRRIVGSLDITAENSGNIYVKNCLIDTPYTHAVRLDNDTSSSLHIKTYFENCYISGNVRVNMNGDYLNAFDILLLRCNNGIEISSNSAINRYTPRIKR